MSKLQNIEKKMFKKYFPKFSHGNFSEGRYPVSDVLNLGLIAAAAVAITTGLLFASVPVALTAGALAWGGTAYLPIYNQNRTVQWKNEQGKDVISTYRVQRIMQKMHKKRTSIFNALSQKQTKQQVSKYQKELRAIEKDQKTLAPAYYVMG